MSASIVSVNVGRPRDVEWAGRTKRTAIVKTAVDGPVEVRTLGIDGDEVADTKYHGGTYQAVYAFAREDLDLWSTRVGVPLPDGQFGENLTTTGIDVNESLVGEQWLIGTTVLEVADVRTPCLVFQRYLGLLDLDSRRWIKRFTEDARPGPYLKVVQAGRLAAGDEITVVHRPDHDITVSLMFKALTTERCLLPRLLEIGVDLAPTTRKLAEKYVAEA